MFNVVQMPLGAIGCIQPHAAEVFTEFGDVQMKLIITEEPLYHNKLHFETPGISLFAYNPQGATWYCGASSTTPHTLPFGQFVFSSDKQTCLMNCVQLSALKNFFYMYIFPKPSILLSRYETSN